MTNRKSMIHGAFNEGSQGLPIVEDVLKAARQVLLFPKLSKALTFGTYALNGRLLKII